MRRPAWLTRNLLVLTLVSLTQDAASELLYPLLPLLITGVLAAPPVVLGVVEGCAEAAAGIAKYVAGRWSDRRGRRPFVAAGYGLAAVGKAVVALAWAWPVVLVGRVVDRLGKGVRSTPRDALIAASVPAGAYGRAFGFHRMGDSVGAVIGPLLGLLALWWLDGDVSAALWWAVLPASLAVALVFLVREPPRPGQPGGGAAARPGAAGSAVGPATAAHRPVDRSAAPLPPQFRRVTAVLVAIAVVNFPDALVLLRVVDLGYDAAQVVLAYVGFNVVYTLASYPAGALADRWGRAAVYGTGLLAFAVGYGGLALCGPGWWVFALVAVYGLFPGLTDGVGKAWISDLVPDEHRGRAQGVFQSLLNGAVFVAGLWAGLLWASGPGSGVVPLAVSATVAATAGVVLVLARRRLHGGPVDAARDPHGGTAEPP